MNKVTKAGSILLSKDHKKVCLVKREKLKDFSFPKGHLEENETLLECAIRETEEETGYACKPITTEPLGFIEYENFEGKVITYMYLLEDIGPTTKVIPDCDKEEPVWLDIKDVEKTLTYSNLQEFWNNIRKKIEG
jgi:mRNA-decapping enzyme subunit 2